VELFVIAVADCGDAADDTGPALSVRGRGQETADRPMLVEGMPPRRQQLLLLPYQRRNPMGTLLVDLPRKGDEGVKIAG
jgi:hypothetical protein